MTERVIHFVLSPYPRWYVYVHYDPRKDRKGEAEQIDNVVYVGKGTRARAWVDVRLSSPDHRRWLRDLQNDGFSPDEFVRIEKRKLTSEQAFKFERQLIASYRERGVLLFNKEKGWSGPARRYENRWMPDPAFGKMPRRCQPPTAYQEVMTEGNFKAAAARGEDQASVTYDLRPFGDRQQAAVAWYLGHLVFRLSAHLLRAPSKAVVLFVDARFAITSQLRGFVRKLKAADIPVEIRHLS
jgi:hypothetical protein